MTVFTIEFEFQGKRYNDASEGLRAFATQLGKDWDGSARVLSEELKLFLTEVTQALATRHGGAWPGGTSSQTLSKRSGALVNSLLSGVKVEGTTFASLAGSISSDVPYAGIQETGGVIKPKTAKYLAIPLPAALNNAGIPLRDGPRSWPNTFVARSKAGNLLIFQKLGTSIIPLYVLKDQVTIPPRLGLGKTLAAGLPYFVEQAMDAMVRNLQKA